MYFALLMATVYDRRVADDGVPKRIISTLLASYYAFRMCNS